MTFLLGCIFVVLMLNLDNILPLIIFRSLEDFVLFISSIVSNEVGRTVGTWATVIILIEIVVGIPLYLQINKERDLIQEQSLTPGMQKLRD